MHQIFGQQKFSAENGPKVHFNFRSKDFYHQNSTAETRSYDDASKNLSQRGLAWDCLSIGVDMSTLIDLIINKAPLNAPRYTTIM